MHVNEDALLVGKLLVLLQFVVDLEGCNRQGRLHAHLGHLSVVTCIYLHQVVDVLLLFPACPNEVALCKVFFLRWLPPIALL